MIRKAAVILASLICTVLSTRAQESFTINDYDLIGVNYGVSFSEMNFANEVKKQERLFNPTYVSLTYTHYLKLFDFLPYFGYQMGLAYGHEGYRFKVDKEKGTVDTEEGATQATIEVVEFPFLAHLHYDAPYFKVMANAGLYAGYRLAITREGPNVTQGLENSFSSTDRRFDYGLQGGAGFGLVFSPVEFHVNALVRYSWSSICEPDSFSGSYKGYFYRYVYPFDINITAGIHIQLTKRTGRTSKDLRRQAREIVIKGWELENEISGNTESQDR